MDDDTPLASEINTHHQKRTRVDTRVAEDVPSRAKGDNGENQDGSSDGSDGSPDVGEREGSQDDFEEIRPKSKRIRAAEGTPDVPNRSVERLIGDGKHISQAVKRWVERYERNPKLALVELLMLLFEACGAKYYIKEEFMDETDVDDVVVALVNIARKAYHRYLELSESEDESLRSEYFQECKNLVSRLAGMFIGVAQNKHRSEILKVVKEGIEYAFQDALKQLSFLEASVLPFASRLSPPDIRDILKDAQKRIEIVNTEEDPSGWRPYNTFYDTLQEKYAKNDVIQDEKEMTTARRKGRPRKRQNIDGRRLFDEHHSSEEDLINTSDQEDAQVEEDERGYCSFDTFPQVLCQVEVITSLQTGKPKQIKD